MALGLKRRVAVKTCSAVLTWLDLLRFSRLLLNGHCAGKGEAVRALTESLERNRKVCGSGKKGVPIALTLTVEKH